MKFSEKIVLGNNELALVTNDVFRGIYSDGSRYYILSGAFGLRYVGMYQNPLTPEELLGLLMKSAGGSFLGGLEEIPETEFYY